MGDYCENLERELTSQQTELRIMAQIIMKFAEYSPLGLIKMPLTPEEEVILQQVVFSEDDPNA